MQDAEHFYHHLCIWALRKERKWWLFIEPSGYVTVSSRLHTQPILVGTAARPATKNAGGLLSCWSCTTDCDINWHPLPLPT